MFIWKTFCNKGSQNVFFNITKIIRYCSLFNILKCQTFKNISIILDSRGGEMAGLLVVRSMHLTTSKTSMPKLSWRSIIAFECHSFLTLSSVLQLLAVVLQPLVVPTPSAIAGEGMESRCGVDGCRRDSNDR
jgi:hypothetical protein